MEKNTNSQKANRILYIVVVTVLCITAVVIGITAAMQKGKNPSKQPSVTTAVTTTAKPTTTTAPSHSDEDASKPETLPSFIAPAEGSVAKEHDLAVLVYSATMDDLRVHRGIDIASVSGSDVLAVADGEISAIYSDPMMGYSIEITHAGGAVSVYKNLTQSHAEGISEGVKVKQGQVISFVGDSAMIESADEAHLHYELTVNGEPVDPMDYISEDSRLASLTQDELYED